MTNVSKKVFVAIKMKGFISGIKRIKVQSDAKGNAKNFILFFGYSKLVKVKLGGIC